MRPINPFYTTNIIPAPFFCDRERETNNLALEIASGNNVLLMSPRRMGKTGLINHLFEDSRIKKTYNTFFIDIYDTSTLRELTFRLGKEVYDKMSLWDKARGIGFLGVLQSLKGEFSVDPVSMSPRFALSVGQINNPEATLDEILEYLNQRFNPNQDRETLFYNEILFEGNYPSDVTWIRPYTVTVPAGSLLDALLFLGGLEHVRLDVKLEPTGGSASFIYSVTDDPAMFDWSTSEYARILPDVEEKEMTLEDAAHWVSDAHEWGRYQCEINDTSKLKARHRLAFGGKSLREVIRLIEVTFDVRYDYREQCWRDPVK